MRVADCHFQHRVGCERHVRDNGQLKIGFIGAGDGSAGRGRAFPNGKPQTAEGTEGRTARTCPGRNGICVSGMNLLRAAGHAGLKPAVILGCFRPRFIGHQVRQVARPAVCGKNVYTGREDIHGRFAVVGKTGGVPGNIAGADGYHAEHVRVGEAAFLLIHIVIIISGGDEVHDSLFAHDLQHFVIEVAA